MRNIQSYQTELGLSLKPQGHLPFVEPTPQMILETPESERSDSIQLLLIGQLKRRKK